MRITFNEPEQEKIFNAAKTIGCGSGVVLDYLQGIYEANLSEDLKEVAQQIEETVEV